MSVNPAIRRKQLNRTISQNETAACLDISHCSRELVGGRVSQYHAHVQTDELARHDVFSLGKREVLLVFVSFTIVVFGQSRGVIYCLGVETSATKTRAHKVGLRGASCVCRTRSKAALNR